MQVAVARSATQTPPGWQDSAAPAEAPRSTPPAHGTPARSPRCTCPRVKPQHLSPVLDGEPLHRVRAAAAGPAGPGRSAPPAAPAGQRRPGSAALCSAESAAGRIPEHHQLVLHHVREFRRIEFEDVPPPGTGHRHGDHPGGQFVLHARPGPRGRSGPNHPAARRSPPASSDPARPRARPGPAARHGPRSARPPPGWRRRDQQGSSSSTLVFTERRSAFSRLPSGRSPVKYGGAAPAADSTGPR